MRVLGLDPGSRRTGWGVVERRGSAFACVDHGCIVPAAAGTLHVRLHHIAAETAAILERFRPDCVVIEEAFHHENVRSTLVLGQVRGALIVRATERGITIAEYAPRAIKLSVAGRGGASKEQVAYMVRRLLGLTGPLAVDASDALAGALCHLTRARMGAALRGRGGPRAALSALAPPRRRTGSSERLAAMLASVRPRRAGGVR